MNKDNKNKLKAIVIVLAVAAAFTLAVVYFQELLGFLGLFFNAVTPLLVGVIIAFVINLIMRPLERAYFPRSKKKLVSRSRRPVCMVLGFLLALMAVVLVVTMVVPELVKAISIVGEGLTVAFESVKGWLEANGDVFPSIAAALGELEIDWPSIVQAVADLAIGGVGSAVTLTLNVVSGLVGGVVNLALTVVFAVHLLATKERLLASLKKTIAVCAKPKLAQGLLRLGREINGCFSAFVVGQCVEAVILGALCAIGMLILRLPYAFMIGALTGVTAIIPIVGAYLGAGLGAFMILTVDPIKAVWFLIFIVVLQQVEGNLIYPRVVGASLGLPGIWVLTAVIVGGGLMGIGGMLIGVPTVATAYKLINEEINRRGELAKNQP